LKQDKFERDRINDLKKRRDLLKKKKELQNKKN
jgi:hypothetical protein